VSNFLPTVRFEVLFPPCACLAIWSGTQLLAFSHPGKVFLRKTSKIAEFSMIFSFESLGKNITKVAFSIFDGSPITSNIEI